MTQEGFLRLTGMRLVGEDKTLRAVGMLLGYPVEATAAKNGKTLTLAFTAGEAKFKVKELRKKIRDDSALKGSVDVLASPDTAQTNVFLVTIKATDEGEAQNLYSLTLTRLEEALRDLPDFAPPAACAICLGAGSDTLATYTGSLNFVHRTCLQKWKYEEEQKFEQKENNPSTLRGLIGGVLGGVVGAFPAFFVLWFLDYFVFLLFALIPMGTVAGWRLFGGKVSGLTSVFVIVYSLLVAVFVDVLDSFLILRDIFGPTVTLMDTIDAYLDMEIFLEIFMRSTLLALGSAIFGIFVSWRYITTTDASNLAATQAIFDQAVSLDRPLEAAGAAEFRE